MVRSARRSPALSGAAALAAAALVLRAALAPADFVAGGGAAPALRGGRARLRAEPEQPGALVKIDEETTATAASLVGGVAGVLVGGPVLGVLGFVGAAFLARQGEDNDAATALKGIGSSVLEVVNFIGGVDKKYEVTGRVGSALDEQVTKVKGQSPQAAELIDGVSNAVASVDKDVGIGSTLGNIVTGGSSLASQAVDKAVETADTVNEKYNITEKIADTVNDVVSKAKGASAPKA